MKIGNSLDALIAEKVMGWGRGPMGWEFGCNEDRCLLDYGSWSPSRSISDAWVVAQKIVDNPRVDDFVIHLSPSKNRECEVEVLFWEPGSDHSSGPYFILGESAAHAICLASLKVMGLA